MTSDEDVIAAVLAQVSTVGGAGMATAKIVERGTRHFVVQVIYPELDIVPIEKESHTEDCDCDEPGSWSGL